MQIETTSLPGVLLLTPRRHGDARGFFSESWNRKTLEDAGVHLPEFVQDNHSMSGAVGTLRGLHYQSPPMAQGKLVRCARGALYDVAVDVREGSSSFGQWFGATLTEENGTQLWIPAGFLHGFVTLLPDTEIAYKCTAHYSPEHDGAVRWDSLGIDWGLDAPIRSEKDAKAPAFVDWKTPFTMDNTR